MSGVEGKAVTGNSERAWVANEFQSRKLKAKLALAASASLPQSGCGQVSGRSAWSRLTAAWPRIEHALT